MDVRRRYSLMMLKVNLEKDSIFSLSNICGVEIFGENNFLTSKSDLLKRGLLERKHHPSGSESCQRTKIKSETSTDDQECCFRFLDKPSTFYQHTNVYNHRYIKRFNTRISSFTTSVFLYGLLLSLLLGIARGAVEQSHDVGRSQKVKQWAVEVKGGPSQAALVASAHGFINLGQIGALEDYYLLEDRRRFRRETSKSLQRELKQDPKVLWMQQQRPMVRVKRGKKRFNDPMWGRMWYINRRSNNMNVMGAWTRGYTGRGVVVSVLDDGLERNHTDLAPNYDPKASHDAINDDPDPLPRYSPSSENSHGTRCAGEVAAVANNRKCMVGIAHHASIGGIRMLDGDVTDAVEAKAFSFRNDYIDIYSSSWGPEDNGILVNGPGKLAKIAFKNGVNKGRKGKGCIYIWASGNGGSLSDSCGCDGYASSIYTLSVAGVSENGSKPWYLEECTSTLATTYSSGDNYKKEKSTD